MLLARFAKGDESDVTDASRWPGDATCLPFPAASVAPSRLLSTGAVLETGGGTAKATGVPGRRGVVGSGATGVGSGATGVGGRDDVGGGASGAVAGVGSRGRGGGATEGSGGVGCREGGRAWGVA